MSEPLAETLAKQGQYDSLSEYQQLKVASEMEREATAKLKEHLKRKHGETAAEQMLREKGYDPEILK